jgi:16S rRNA (adenine1518-N6/adenine1519-N6)-dimethyltransferase
LRDDVKTPDYNSGPALKAFLQERGFAFRKRWGQNFLINPSARGAIAAKLDFAPNDAVWEIGPGLGSMTVELFKNNARVSAFEVDAGFCSIIRELFQAEIAGKKLQLIQGDVRKTWKEQPAAPYLLGNLPYTIALLLLGNFIESGVFFKRMVVTVQKEAAERITSRPGDKNYSAISLLCSLAYTAKIFMTLKGASFYPAPRVDSACVCLDLLEKPLAVPPRFFTLVRSLFAARRKTLRNNLEYFLSHSAILKGGGNIKDAMQAALDGCRIAGNRRAETLGPFEAASLARELERYFEWNGL